MKQSKLFLSLAVLAVAFLTGCTRIGPGHAGIKINNAGSDKGVSEQTASTGWFWYNPFSETVIEYQTAQRQEKWTKNPNEGQTGNQEVSFTNKDSMVIFADVAIAFSLDAARVPAFYVKFLAKDEDDLDVKFTNGYLKNQVRNCLNDNAGQYDVKQIMGDNAEFLNKTKKCIADNVAQWGVQIDQFGLIGAPRPPDQIVAAINNKSAAEQDAQRKQIELTQVTADVAKNVAQAEGDAKAQIARAQGEAEANRLRNTSITENILKMRFLDNQHDLIWNLKDHPGILPQTLVLSGAGGNNSVPGILFQVPTTK
jgi:regulator of protease activity HflC (stomatin/prohibitin superfamily)